MRATSYLSYFRERGGREEGVGFAASTVLRRSSAAARESSGPDHPENEIRIALVRIADREGEKEREREIEGRI